MSPGREFRGYEPPTQPYVYAMTCLAFRMAYGFRGGMTASRWYFYRFFGASVDGYGEP